MKPKEDFDVPLSERIKLRQPVKEPATNPAAAYKTSAFQEMTVTEREALVNGNGKRRPEESPVQARAANVQKKRVANVGGRRRAVEDSDDEEEIYEQKVKQDNIVGQI